MEKLSREEIKSIQLEMLKYIDNVCKNNKIKYTLIGGSLIGAIRHKGMVPWDDDIDIGMVEEEYNKLIPILIKEQGKYKLLNHDTNKYYYFAMSKLCDTSTKVIEKDFEEIDDYGIYIDIFIYRQYGNDMEYAKRIYKKENYYHKMLGGIKKPNYGKNFIKNILLFLRHVYIKIVGRDFYFNKLEKLYKTMPKEGKLLLSNWHVYSFEKEIKNTDMFSDYIEVPFENLKVLIIKNYDDFLRPTFNNYMELPPVEKRVTHDLTVYKRGEK